MTITTQQARQRFTTIPERLQDAIFSVQTAEIMDGIAEQYHLDDTKMAVVTKITGRVLLGFYHPEDVTKEIQAQLNFSSELAQDIAKSLSTKIFSSLNDDLAKAYAPAPESKEEEVAGPKILQEVASPQVISTSFVAKPIATPPPSAPKPPSQVISQTVSGISLGATPLASNKNVPPVAPQPAKPENSKGWSSQTPQGPVVKLGIITPNIPTPPRSASSVPTITRPVVSPVPGKTVSEFDRLDMNKKAPPTPEPAPVMLHQVSDSTPLQKSPDFRFSMGMQDQMSGKGSQIPTPPKPAVLELGVNRPPIPTPPKPPTIRPQGTPISNTGPRQITEIGGQSQTATPPPTSAPKEKVIVKDFLGPQK